MLNVLTIIIMFTDVLYMDLAICDPVCENGGVCTQERTCHCISGYEGQRCEEGTLHEFEVID